MAASPEERARNRKTVIDLIANQLDDYQARGFWGTLSIDFDFKDGLIDLVRKHGEEETVKIPS